MTNTFIAHRTARRGVVRVEATLADFAFPAHSHDQSHMTRELRRLLGISPAAYRRALQ